MFVFVKIAGWNFRSERSDACQVHKQDDKQETKKKTHNKKMVKHPEDHFEENAGEKRPFLCEMERAIEKNDNAKKAAPNRTQMYSSV